jgi:hypothetical protein
VSQLLKYHHSSVEIQRIFDTLWDCRLAISVVNGFVYMQKLSWNNFNEGMTLIETVKRFRDRHGCYPESVHIDEIYRTRENIRYCKEHGIRISGPRLGRPPKEPSLVDKKLARQDALDRNHSEKAVWLTNSFRTVLGLAALIWVTPNDVIKNNGYFANRLLSTLFDIMPISSNMNWYPKSIRKEVCPLFFPHI